MKLNIKKIIVIAALFLISSCHVAQPRYHYQKEFEILSGHQIISDSITVIPGKNRNIDLLLVKYLTDELEKKSTFKVTSFSKTYKAVENANDLIIETEESKRIDTSTLQGASWVSEATKQNVSKLFKRFKSKYIYVVWVSSLSELRGGEKFISIFVDGRFFELSRNEVIAFTYEDYNQKIGPFNFKTMAENIDFLIKEAAVKLSEEILSVTNLKKQ